MQYWFHWKYFSESKKYIKSIPRETSLRIKKSSYTVLEALNFPRIDKFDRESNFSELKWVIHHGLRRAILIYQSDRQEISISQHHWNGVQWRFLTKIELKKEEYKKLLELLPDLLSYVEAFKKTSITLDK